MHITAFLRTATLAVVLISQAHAGGLGDDPAKFDQLIESAYLHRDYAFLETSVADDARFSHFISAQDETKQLWLSGSRLGQSAARDVEHVKIDRKGAVVTTTGSIRVTPTRTTTNGYRVSYERVYAKRDDGWKLVSHRTVAQESLPAARARAASGEMEDGAYRPGNGVSEPRLIRQVRAGYTADGMRAGIQGKVILECIVKPDGTVGDVYVLQSLDARFGLDEQAMKAAKQSRFAPGMRDGVPVPVWVTIESAFTMDRFRQ